MKRLTCEMCGSTNLIKIEGLFECQDCGTKYSVEEAKKMMVEVEGTVHVQNAAQLDNLLNMAHSSFDSKNYAKAEEFCNQILAMDDQNYEAWKLKGEAINYQISSTNPRILEVYNCIMTSYRVLSDEEKLVKRDEILSSIKTCFEGEVAFWLNQFESGRPTSAALLKVKSTYFDSYSKLKEAFDELGLEEAKEEYLKTFDNFFIGKCNAICTSAWTSTVGYNYYRNYLGKGLDPFGRSDSDQRWIIKDTDLYRPRKNTWDTFISETDNLINLLQFAEKRMNDETNPKVMEAVFSNIAFYEDSVIPSGSWKITQGYTSNWDQYQSVGWHEEYCLNDTAKSIRRRVSSEYKTKERTVPSKLKAMQAEKERKDREKRISDYWNEHKEEKAALDSEKTSLVAQHSELKTQIASIDEANAPKIKELNEKRAIKTPAEEDVNKQDELIRDLEYQRSKCGFFKKKERNALTERIEQTERPRLDELKKKAEEERSAKNADYDSQIAEIKNEGQDLRDKAAQLMKRISEIDEELTKDRK